MMSPYRLNSIALLLSILAAAACHADEPDEGAAVVWSANTPPGTHASIDERGALLLEMGGPDFCPDRPCRSLGLTTPLPLGDFEIRFHGVVLTNIGEIGAFVSVGDHYANARFARFADGYEGVMIDTFGKDEYGSVGVANPWDDSTPPAEFTLIRHGDELSVRATYGTNETTDDVVVEDGDPTLVLYLEPDEDASAADTLAAAIDRRAIDGLVTSFAADLIEDE